MHIFLLLYSNHYILFRPWLNTCHSLSFHFGSFCFSFFLFSRSISVYFFLPFFLVRNYLSTWNLENKCQSMHMFPFSVTCFAFKTNCGLWELIQMYFNECDFIFNFLTTLVNECKRFVLLSLGFSAQCYFRLKYSKFKCCLSELIAPRTNPNFRRKFTFCTFSSEINLLDVNIFYECCLSKSNNRLSDNVHFM